MLLTEEEIGSRAGLPGPVVAELLHPRSQSRELTAETGPKYGAEDALRAEIAAAMFAFGIRWRWVQSALSTMPDDLPTLQRARRDWAELAAETAEPPSRGRVCVESAMVTALMVLAFLLGLLAGLAGAVR